ncbi:metallophosphoesterase family protein [Lentilactobacillus hilgardii]|uniref:metallophosphoesterase family protein n=1 Tax=Lentilactobacillus hilgardii TaxID=1588 RepID=UPI00019C5361|nr:metallophosphoesterase family protein [Lentilactobacillus hilgardii]EEI72646.1 SH3 domain protein [Lentilactobacillus hilgardii ATCC 27305]
MDTTAAQNTPDGYTLSESGQFQFNTNCKVRSTPDMSATGESTVKAGSYLNFDGREKNGNHFWFYYTDATGVTHYVPYANIDDGQYFGSFTNGSSDDPIQSSSTGGNTGSGDGGSVTGTGLGTLTGQDGANVANQTPDGTSLAIDGSFTFDIPMAAHKDSTAESSVVGPIDAGTTLNYNGKVKDDNYYWLRYEDVSTGNTLYAPYASIDPFQYYGTDSNPGDPVYASGTGTGSGSGTGTGGSSTGSSRTQGGTDTGTPTLSGQTPVSSLEGYEFPSNGIVHMDSGAATRTAPVFDDSHETGTTHKAGDNVHYVAKTNGNDRMWVKFTDGNYMPIGKLDTLSGHDKSSGTFNGTKFHEQVGYVHDQNYEQPWQDIWPYIQNTTNTDWDSLEDSNSIETETVDTNFTPSSDEQTQLEQFNEQVNNSADQHDDDVLIAYITDTHYDSYKTPATARVLHSMMLMSWYAKTYGVDLVVHGGDVNDGVKPKDLSKIDVNRAVDAIKLSQRPYIILQGNHDDNSGYARNITRNDTTQVLGNDDAWNIRGSQWLNRPTQNRNNAVFGTYDVPNSNLSIVVLDGFDQPDELEDNGKVDFYSFRHGYTHYDVDQLKWLPGALNNVPAGNKILVFDHISLNGVSGWKQEERSPFENNSITNPTGVNESNEIFRDLTNYQSNNRNILGTIVGHTHEDDQTVAGGIQFIRQTCALSDRGDGQGQRTIDGRDNNAWTILRISPSAGTVHQYRFGWSNTGTFLNNWSL